MARQRRKGIRKRQTLHFRADAIRGASHAAEFPPHLSEAQCFMILYENHQVHQGSQST